MFTHFLETEKLDKAYAAAQWTAGAIFLMSMTRLATALIFPSDDLLVPTSFSADETAYQQFSVIGTAACVLWFGAYFMREAFRHAAAEEKESTERFEKKCLSCMSNQYRAGTFKELADIALIPDDLSNREFWKKDKSYQDAQRFLYGATVLFGAVSYLLLSSSETNKMGMGAFTLVVSLCALALAKAPAVVTRYQEYQEKVTGTVSNEEKEQQIKQFHIRWAEFANNVEKVQRKDHFGKYAPKPTLIYPYKGSKPAHAPT